MTGFEPAASCSQSRRATNCATPGYLVFYPAGRILPNVAPYQLSHTRIFNFCHYTTAGRKIKDFLSVVIPVVKAAFVPFSAIGANPANAGVARLCGISPYPVPDTATALPKQARYQLRSPPEIFIFTCAAIRCALLCSPGLRFPKKILALFACSIFSTAECAV